MSDSHPTPAPLPDVRAGYYRHYKGKDYRVLGVARHTETEEPFVVYQALYGERGLWVRPAALFVGKVEVNGVQLERFALVMAE